MRERQYGWDLPQNAPQHPPYKVLFLESWDICAGRQARDCLFQHRHFMDEATENQEREDLPKVALRGQGS